jgi:hypothetical protein
LFHKLGAAPPQLKGEYAFTGQLENAGLGKTDGCKNSGAPNKDDWLKDCAAKV